jgi:3-methylfumaryl-CoA hydratase
VDSLQVDGQKVRDLAGLLGSGDELELEHLPPLWHWVATSRWAPMAAVRPDGHPVAVAEGVPAEFSRRMFAGGEVVLHGEVPVGSELEREVVSTTNELKEGRTGSFVLSKVEVEYRSGGSLAIAERQDIVYRPASTASSDLPPVPVRGPAGPVLPRSADGAWPFSTDPVALMRFSALTANSHRIHYDWPYATTQEGYPDLVVHGPLMTLSCLAVFERTGGARHITRVRHRNLAPLFCGEDASVALEPIDGGTALTLSAHRDGVTTPCVSVHVEWSAA